MSKRRLGKALRQMVGTSGEDFATIETRKPGSSLFMNETRQKLYEHVFKTPGIHIRKLARELKLTLPSANWHLKLLERGNYLGKLNIKNKMCYYPSHIVDASDVFLFSTLNHAPSRKAYTLIRNTPGISQREVYSSLNTYQQRIAFTLFGLEEAGLLVKTKTGRSNGYRATEKLDDAILRIEEKLPDFTEWLLEKLVEDGVNPRLISSARSRLKVRLSTGQSKRDMVLALRMPK